MDSLKRLIKSERVSMKDILRNGDIVDVVSGKSYVYIKDTETFKGNNSFFYLHNLDDNLMCGIGIRTKPEFDYSIETIHTSTTLETASRDQCIIWTR